MVRNLSDITIGGWLFHILWCSKTIAAVGLKFIRTRLVALVNVKGICAQIKVSACIVIYPHCIEQHEQVGYFARSYHTYVQGSILS